jgi:amino acid adenylation domain-containing protein
MPPPTIFEAPNIAPGTPDAGRQDGSLPEWFELQAELHASKLAIGSGDWQPTYRELNEAANRFAHDLISRECPPETRAALLMRHGAPLLAAMLAVLKAGWTVVVLNPGDPPARLKQILADAEPEWIITDAASRQLAREISNGRDCLEFEPSRATGLPDNPARTIAPGAIAFLMYTSGSTGHPKGVMQSHRNLAHNATRLSRGMSIAAGDRVILLAALSGGQGVGAAWAALLSGATLCPFPAMEKGVIGLAGWLTQHRITVWISAVSVFRHFIKTLDEHERVRGIRLLRLASEPATSRDFADFKKHFPDDCVLLNTFSSTETGNITQWPILPSSVVPEGVLPAGRPADGIEILLVDEHGRETVAGATGEIVVKSRYLSPGYWRNEVLTAERFHPATDAPGVRLFHTGDLGRFDDGVLIFLGRKDDRVKIRGYRVEISEIEHALNRMPGVESAVVCARDDAQGEAQLAAFVIPAAAAAVSPEQLRRELRAILPVHMIPAAFILLDRFPLTAHGKIDRGALRALTVPAPEIADGERPASETEKLLARLWQEILGCGPVGCRHDFFDLGGDSLKAAVIGARVFAALNVELNLACFSEHPTLADLAHAIDGLRGRGNLRDQAPLVRAPRDQPLPLSLSQERTWKHLRTIRDPASYTMAFSYRLRGPLDVDALRASMDYLVRRHEMLRTTFAEIDGRPVQQAHPAGPAALTIFDVSHAADPPAEADRIFREMTRVSFDLAQLPLLRFALVRLRPDEHWLLRTNHHIISDAWSWTIYFRELAQVYEAKLAGSAPPLPEFEPLQYADYAVWQRALLRRDGPRYRQTLDWWRQFLAGAPRSLRLPGRRLWRARRVDPAAGQLAIALDPALLRAQAELERAENTTTYIIGLAAFSAVLARAANASDLVLGTHMTHRNRVETQNMFGFFANVVMLRLRCDPSLTFREWIRHVRRTAGEVQARSEIPYEPLCEELRAAGATLPKLQVTCNLTTNIGPMHFGGAELTWLDRRRDSMLGGWNLVWDQCPDQSRLLLMFDAHVYQPAQVRRFFDRLSAFLELATRSPDGKIEALLALKPSYRTESSNRWRRGSRRNSSP